MKYQVSRVLNLNKQEGRNKYSLLHHAAAKRNERATDMLLSCGADRTLRTKKGLTAFEMVEKRMQRRKKTHPLESETEILKGHRLLELLRA